MALHLEGMCRLCMKQHQHMSNIFTQKNGVWMKLSQLLPKLEMHPEDGLPSKVCRECLLHVHSLHHFVTQCEVSDATLRKYVRKQFCNGNKKVLPTAVIVKEEEPDVEGDSTENSSSLRISSTFSLNPENTMTWNESSSIGIPSDVDEISNHSIADRIETKVKTRSNLQKTAQEPNTATLGQKPGNLELADIDSDTTSQADSSPSQNSLKLPSSSAISDNPTKRELMLQLKKSSLASSVRTVKFKEHDNGVIPTVPPVMILQQNINSPQSNIVTPQDKHSSTSEKLKPYKLSKWKYFIPVELLKKNKILKLQKPGSENTSNRTEGPMSGNTSNGSDGPMPVSTSNGSDGPKSGNTSNGLDEPMPVNTCSMSDRPVSNNSTDGSESPMVGNSKLVSGSTSNESDRPVPENAADGSERLWSNGLESPDNEFICRIPAALERTCEECGRMCPSELMYRRHKLSHEMHACNKCGKVFPRLSQLKDHSRTHSGEKLVAALCEKCGKCFANPYSFKKHNKLHLGLKPFQCPKCKKSFSAKHILKRHILTHRKKPFVCELCGRVVRNKTMLLRHKQMYHQVRKKYKCALCPNSYHSKAWLKIHVTVHTGEKPFKCRDCDKSFAYQKLLSRHSVLHTQERNSAHTNNIYRCANCSRKFASLQDIKSHIRNVHGKMAISLD